MLAPYTHHGRQRASGDAGPSSWVNCSANMSLEQVLTCPNFQDWTHKLNLAGAIKIVKPKGWLLASKYQELARPRPNLQVSAAPAA